MIGVGEILAQTRRLLSVDPVMAIAAILLLSGLGFLFDTGVVSNNSFNLLITGATLALQFALTRRLLRRMGYAMPGKPRGGAFIGLSIIAGLALIAGLLLLVVPGIILLVRWSLGTPILISSEESITNTLRHSWHHTDGHFWAIFISLLVIYVPFVAMFGAALVMSNGSAFAELVPEEVGGLAYAGILIANLAMNSGIVGGWIAAVAIFSLLQSSSAVADVFE